MELNKKTLRWIFLGVAGCILFYWLLHETERVGHVLGIIWRMLSPFAIGAAIAFILNVPMRGIEKWFKGIRKERLRRALAIIVTFLFVAVILAAVILLLIPQLVNTVETIVSNLPGFFERTKNTLTNFLDNNPQVWAWVQEYTDYEHLDWSKLIEKAVSLLGNGATGLVNGVISAITSLSTGIFNAILSVVFAVYCLARKEILARQGRRLVYSLLPEKTGDEVIRVLRLSNTTFSNFISGQCLEAVILGLLFAICMTICDFPYMPLVSVVIAITALVPIVGAFAGCILGAFFILVDNPMQAVWFVVMFLVLQQIEGNLIYPKVVGKSIGLPGMWVLVAIAVGGSLMGVGGMLLMIPIASVLYALLREFTNKRVAERGIPREKLMDQPPDHTLTLWERQKVAREKRREKRALKKQNKE